MVLAPLLAAVLLLPPDARAEGEAKAPATAPADPLSFNVTSSVQMKLGGSFQTEYAAAKNTADGLSAKKARLRLEARAPELPDFLLKAQTEFAQNPALLDLVIEFSRKGLLPEPLRFKLSAGQFKPPFSREHLVNDDLIETLTRTAAVEALAPGRDTGTKGRDIGGMAELGASLWGRKDLAVYRIGAFNGEGANTAEKNDQKNLTTRLELAPLAFLSLGGSYSRGRRGSPRKVNDRKGWDAKASCGPVSLAYEQIYGQTDSVKAKGQYLLGVLGFRKGAIELVGRYDWFDPNLGAADDRTYTTTAGVNWYAARTLKLAVDYEFRGEEGTETGNDTFIASLLYFF